MKPFERLAAWAWGGLAALAALDCARLLPLSRLEALPLCVFRALTGLPCPGCGMTHALISAFEGHWNAAWRLHPLALPLLAVWTTWLAWGARNRVQRKEFSAGWPDLLAGARGWALLSIVLGVHAIRLASASAAAVDAGCSFDAKSLAPMLADRVAGLGTVSRRREAHQLVEEAVLADGIHLKLVQGGCEHFAKSFELRAVHDPTNLFDRAHFLKAASDLLRRPIGPGAAPLDADFAQALRGAAPRIRGWLREDSGKVWGNCFGFRCTTAFKCELAVCTIETKREAGDALSITLTYDYH